MKKLLFSSLLLCTLPLTVACGNNDQTETSQSEMSSKKDYIKEAEAFIDDDKMYQAQDMLETAKEEGNSEQKEEAEAILEQIDLYQTALDNTKDERYDVALDNLDKVIDENNGSSAMKDKAYEEKDKVRDLQDEKEEEEEKKQDEEKAQKEEDNKQDSSNQTEHSDWSSAKTSQLASFMNSWEQQMGQHYKKMSFSTTHTMTYGGASLDSVINDEVIPYINGQQVDFSYSKDSGCYQVVDYYEGETNDGTPTSYTFTISPSGQPLVLVAQYIGEGGMMRFKPTANQTLQNGFANIVNS